MNAPDTIAADAEAELLRLPTLDRLREPFPPHHISKLPKESRKQKEDREKNRQLTVWNCEVCGGYHHKDAVHLDYVGHAAVTDRLLDVDPMWSWEPVPNPDALGLPVAPGGMWIKLTVLGMTRLGYGSADGKKGGDAVKELIGDAIRNAAMRFGVALDLWHKGDLRATEQELVNPGWVDNNQWSLLQRMIEATGTNLKDFLGYYGVTKLDEFPAEAFDHARTALQRRLDKQAAAQAKLPPPDQRDQHEPRDEYRPPANEFAGAVDDDVPF